MRTRFHVQGDDVGFARRQRQDTLPATASEERWVRSLERARGAGHVGHLVELAGKGDRVAGEERLNDAQGLRQSGYSGRGWIKGQAKLRVVALHRAGAQP